eukprot:TRINITY_DN19159_c0_g1_i1.p2 TRINITY_DN19159_c0_g1~~TRINITY_DN19159_c0_g1_i1.p2  ORF type:complete len:189 (+),score=45.80 TRINITY_DN19159_c0_g1_i1:58-624(+)
MLTVQGVVRFLSTKKASIEVEAAESLNTSAGLGAAPDLDQTKPSVFVEMAQLRAEGKFALHRGRLPSRTQSVLMVLGVLFRKQLARPPGRQGQIANGVCDQIAITEALGDVPEDQATSSSRTSGTSSSSSSSNGSSDTSSTRQTEEESSRQNEEINDEKGEEAETREVDSEGLDKEFGSVDRAPQPWM